jgi:basic membrane lipoprotein Med (substrate-binding protein (PBP1-ABC) superfamily)
VADIPCPAFAAAFLAGAVAARVDDALVVDVVVFVAAPEVSALLDGAAATVSASVSA